MLSQPETVNEEEEDNIDEAIEEFLVFTNNKGSNMFFILQKELKIYFLDILNVTNHNQTILVSV